MKKITKNFDLKKIFITYFTISITNPKFNEITILKPLDVYVLLYLQHSSRNSQIIQILYIKRTYILCNNIQLKRKDTKSLYTHKINSITRVRYKILGDGKAYDRSR